MVNNKIKENNSYIIVDISGGFGKNIMSTAFIRAIKKQYVERKIIVVCSWDSPFFSNPNIFRFYPQNVVQQAGIYFKDDYLNEDTLIFKHDPYNESNHILRKEHLVETWCKMFGIKHDGNKPDIIINARELEVAKDKIKPDKRPIMIIQTHGGSPQSQPSKKSWYRDLPVNIAQKIINHFKTKYRILHYKLPEQPSFEGVEPLNLPHRELMAVFPLSEKRLLIDSSSQHIATALNLKSTVCWVGNDPKVFGYEMHNNILPNAKIINKFDKYTYLQDDISGFIHQFPYDTVDLFNVDEIIATVEAQK
jgi:hypothetical protein